MGSIFGMGYSSTPKIFGMGITEFVIGAVVAIIVIRLLLKRGGKGGNGPTNDSWGDAPENGGGSDPDKDPWE